jgi:hypothetical protein
VFGAGQLTAQLSGALALLLGDVVGDGQACARAGQPGDGADANKVELRKSARDALAARQLPVT